MSGGYRYVARCLATAIILAIASVSYAQTPAIHGSSGSAAPAVGSIDHVLIAPPPAPAIQSRYANRNEPVHTGSAAAAPITAIDHVLLIPAPSGTTANGAPSAIASVTPATAQDRRPEGPNAPITAIDHVLTLPAGHQPARDAVSTSYAPLHLHMPPTAGEMLLAALKLPGSATPGELKLSQTADGSFRNPILWSVMAYKAAHKVKVYYKGYLFASYNAVFGRNPDPGAKEWAGDLKTPEGVYEIVEKYRNSRWHWFLRLNYPNAVDRRRYESLLDRGLVPVIDGHRRQVGGEIGIHGTDRPRFNRLDMNWTLGCISVDNGAIDTLYRILPVGTVVIINP